MKQQQFGLLSTIVAVVIAVVVVHHTHLVMLTCVLSDELAMPRVGSVNPMMMRTPVSWRPNILIAAIPVRRTFRVIRTITDFYIYTDSFCTRTHDHRGRHNRGKQNRYFFSFCNHTKDSVSQNSADVTQKG